MAKEPQVFARLAQQDLDRISDLFARKAAALPSHHRQVAAERDNPTHTLTRHGYQTGWESQLMRLVTGRTPDQPDDFDGVRDAVVKYREKEALPKSQQGKISYAPADSVGAFLSPEVEQFAIDRARAKAAPLMPYHFAETVVKGKAPVWSEYDYIDMVVSGPHQLSGVSFKRIKGKAPLAEADAVRAIEDFIKQTRVDSSGDREGYKASQAHMESFESVGMHAPWTRAYYRRTYKLRFPTMDTLLEYLGVQALWMKNVNVALRRFGQEWRIHTAYCVGCIEQPSPTRGGPSVKTGKWTGKVRTTKDGPEITLDPNAFA